MHTHLLILALAFSPLPGATVGPLAGGVPVQDAGEQPAAAPEVPLRLDRRLHARLTVVENNPPLPELLQRLQEATAVALTLDPNLQRHEPELGGVQMREAPAFAFMELLASRDLVNGR